MKWVAGLTAGAVWLLAAMPALAQPAGKAVDELTESDMDELYCVYDELDFYADRVALTNGYMADNQEEASYKAQLDEVEAAVAECSTDFGWDEARGDSAGMIGFYSVIGDELQGRLMLAGLTQADIDAFFGVVEKMSDADLSSFIDGSWESNAGLLQRIRAGAGEKAAKNDVVFQHAAFLAEAYVIVVMLTNEWVTTMPEN